MFVWRSTYDEIVRDRDRADAYALEAHRQLEKLRAENAGKQIVIDRQHRANCILDRNAEHLQSEVDRLTAELASRQVPAVRGTRGRFVKREG